MVISRFTEILTTTSQLGRQFHEKWCPPREVKSLWRQLCVETWPYMQSTVKFLSSNIKFLPLKRFLAVPIIASLTPAIPCLASTMCPNSRNVDSILFIQYLSMFAYSVYLYIFMILMYLMYLYWPAYLYIIILYIYSISIQTKQASAYVTANNQQQKKRLLGNLPSSRPWGRRQSHTLAGPSSCRVPSEMVPTVHGSRRRMDSTWDFFETPKCRNLRKPKNPFTVPAWERSYIYISYIYIYPFQLGSWFPLFGGTCCSRDGSLSGNFAKDSCLPSGKLT